MTVIDITKPKSRPKHTMSILRNEPSDFEAYCETCGKHVFKIKNRWIASDVGDIEAHHVYPVRSNLGVKTLDFEATK